MKPVILCWSGGKDSSIALARLLSGRRYKVKYLLTTVNAKNNRVSMHGLRKELVDRQAEELDIPVEYVKIPEQASNQIYENRMLEQLTVFREELGIGTVAFGDIFLQGIRKYREQLAGKANMEAIFPIWQENTRELARQFIDQGFEAVTLCVDNNKLSPDFVGRPFDNAFLFDLPEQVDRCGENGEFHTFVYNSPNFEHPIPIKTGREVKKDYRLPYNHSFTFCDLEPVH